MTRPALVRFRALGLLAAAVALTAGALWIGGASDGAAVVRHTGHVAVADADHVAVVSTTAEVRTTSGWILPLAAIGAAIGVALRSFVRRNPASVRATFPVKQRLVRAHRRAPPRVLAVPLF